MFENTTRIWNSFLEYRSHHPVSVNIGILVLLVVASVLIGRWLAKALRSVDYGWKFAVILFALLASVVVIVLGWPPRLGVDLGGGSILVYKVDESKTEWRAEKMDSLITSISKRVNPGGQKEIAIRRLGSNMVEIVMPSVSGSTKEEKRAESEQIKKIIRTTGALEFRIVATKRENESLIETAKQVRKSFGAIPQTPVVIRDSKTGKELAKWCRVRDQEVSKLRDDQGNMLEAAMKVGTVKEKDKDNKEVEKDVWDVLLLNDPYNVTGADVRDARAERDQQTGNDEVGFSFNSAGAARFGRLTGEHVPVGDFKYHLAIVLDNVVQTAPTIQSAITDNGRITGNFTRQEVDDIVEIINAGSLPAALEQTPVRDMTTDATLGAETIRQSTHAMIIASIAVPLFMLVYYHFAGLVAVLVLSLNMIILVALMILIKAPFTLPALAGLALTVGMAVDNNVLIYERLREELAHGAALRMAIRNAFHRVGVVIVDANITHLIAATVLWSVGTEQIKGFAVTFWLGAVLSIWATMFVARVMFEVAERRRWVQRLSMMQWIGHTKIDFMAWFPACATFSVLITVLGLVIAVVRGQGLFDIDFTGGVSVQTVFQKEQAIKDIRAEIDSIREKLPDATVTPAHQEDEPDDQRFIIDTSNSNRAEVESLLKNLFGERLVTLDLTARPPEPEKPAAKPKEDKTEKPAAATAKPAEKPAEKPATKPEEKPSEPPRDMSQPTPKRPADTTKPPENKPPENKAKQSQQDLPPLSLVAMAGPESVLLAQADPTAAKTDAKPPAPTATKADAKPLAPAAAQADAKPPAKAEATTELPAGNESAAKAESAAEQVYQETLTLSSRAPKLKDGAVTNEPQPVRYDQDRLEKLVEQALEKNQIPLNQVQIELTARDGSKTSDSWDLKLASTSPAYKPLTAAKFQAVVTTLKSEVLATPYFPIVDNIGSAVANDTRFWAVVALVSSWSLIILYLWIRFQGVAFGLAAVIALIHDVLVMLGAIAFSTYLAKIPGFSAILLIEPFKINLPIVAAFLTIIGYSVNDTIVVFDRIREIRGKSPTLTRQMVNDATNQTLSRTVLTSFTVMLVVIILYIFGGQAVHGFAFALIIGVLTGTYSSIYVAAPILLWLLHPKEMKAPPAGGTSVGTR